MPRRKRDRRHDNPGRPPVGDGSDARLQLKLPSALLESTQAAAEAEGVKVSEWWRRAALARLGQ